MRIIRGTSLCMATTLLTLSVTWAPNAAAQRKAVLDSGIVAFEDVSYDAATKLLRRALATRGVDSLSPDEQLLALSYLGVAEYYRHQPDSAAAAFRRLIARAPYHHLDTLVFAAPVSSYFNEVRRALHAVVMARSLGDSVEVLVLPLVQHHATIDVRAVTGTRVATLYDGMVRDSLHLVWSGRRADGTRVPPGPYELVATTRTADARTAHEARFTVMMTRASVGDSLPSALPVRARTPPAGAPPPVIPGTSVAPPAVLPPPVASASPSAQPPVATVWTRRDQRSGIWGYVSSVDVATGASPSDASWVGWTTGIGGHVRAGLVSLEADYAEGWVHGSVFAPDTTSSLVVLGPAPTGSRHVERRRVAEGAVVALVAPTPWLSIGGGPQARAVGGTPAERWLYWNVALRLRVPLARAAEAALRLDRAIGGRAGDADALRSGMRGEVEVTLGQPENQWQLLIASGVQRGTARAAVGSQEEQHVRLGLRYQLP